jgi:hypothetical protein
VRNLDATLSLINALPDLVLLLRRDLSVNCPRWQSEWSSTGGGDPDASLSIAEFMMFSAIPGSTPRAISATPSSSTTAMTAGVSRTAARDTSSSARRRKPRRSKGWDCFAGGGEDLVLLRVALTVNRDCGILLEVTLLHKFQAA